MVGLELDIVTCRRASEVFVDLGNNGARPDFVVVVGGGETRDGFAFMGGFDIDGDVVAVFGGTLNGLQFGEVLAKVVDLLVDFFV